MEGLPAKPEKQLGGCTGKGFLPGQSGNLRGGPKRKPDITRWLQKMHDEVPEGEEQARTRGQLVALAVYHAAIEGDMRAAKLILDRIEPVPTQSITINNQVGASGLMAIEALRADKDKFIEMLRANGVCKN